MPDPLPQHPLVAYPRILPAGDSALILEFGNAISAKVHDLVVAMDHALTDQPIAGVTEWVPSYRSVMVCYDPALLRGRDLARMLQAAVQDLHAGQADRRLWHVPVLYGHEAGLDLDELAQAKDLSVPELIALHGSVDLRVYMIGFAPGFTYLGGLPEILHTPRLKTPRQLTPAGGIAIGGAQASVGARPGPSGWRFLGRTPLRAFDPKRAKSGDVSDAFLFRSGDLVRFHAVTPAEAQKLDARSEAGEICAEFEVVTA